MARFPAAVCWWIRQTDILWLLLLMISRMVFWIAACLTAPLGYTLDYLCNLLRLQFAYCQII